MLIAQENHLLYTTASIEHSCLSLCMCSSSPPLSFQLIFQLLDCAHTCIDALFHVGGVLDYSADSPTWQVQNARVRKVQPQVETLQVKAM